MKDPVRSFLNSCSVLRMMVFEGVSSSFLILLKTDGFFVIVGSCFGDGVLWRLDSLIVYNGSCLCAILDSLTRELCGECCSIIFDSFLELGEAVTVNCFSSNFFKSDFSSSTSDFN